MMPKVSTCISNGLHKEKLHNLCRSTYLHQLAELCDLQKYSSQRALQYVALFHNARSETWGIGAGGTKEQLV